MGTPIAAKKAADTLLLFKQAHQLVGQAKRRATKIRPKPFNGLQPTGHFFLTMITA